MAWPSGKAEACKASIPSSNLGATLFFFLMLYIIPTPIGNLKDLTYRAVETLSTCDLILCEDTRVSTTLLRHYDIEVPLKSYHQFNEASRENEIVKELKSGKTIALITDAGTPAISDPGSRLVKRCRLEQISVTALPGPCAVTTALSGSGIYSEKFQFIGFLPKKTGQLREALIDALLFRGTTAAYESPHRLLETLKAIGSINSDARLTVCRELTKKFEEYKTNSINTLIDHYASTPPKGEIVLLIEGNGEEIIRRNFEPAELVTYFQKTFNLSSKDALKLSAEKTGLPKRELYKKLFTKQD